MSSEYGVQRSGEFLRKDLPQIQEDLLQRAEEKIPNFDPAPGSPDRQRIDFVSIELVDQWEALEATFDAGYFDTAHDVQLDRLLALAGVGRIPRRPATGEVTFSTPNGTVSSRDITISRGTLVSTDKRENGPPLIFKTMEAVTLKEGQTEVDKVKIKAISPHHPAADRLTEEDLGKETNIGANTITNLVEPISGIGNVTNPEPTGQTGVRPDGTEYDFVSGRERESDENLRTRYKNSLALNAKASLEAIRANVYNAGDDNPVRSVKAEENVTMNNNTASGGLPPKSFRAMVLAPNTAVVDDAVAQAIYETRSAGIQSYGSDSGTAVMTGGGTRKENFARAKEIQIYVDVDIIVSNDFPKNGKDRIKQDIIAYIGGQLSNGEYFYGQDIGDNVIYDQVFSAVMSNNEVIERAAGGINIDDSSKPSKTSDITIKEDEVGRVKEKNISVSTTEGRIQ